MIEDDWAAAVADLLDLVDAVLNRDPGDAYGFALGLAAEYGNYADDPDVDRKRRP